MKQLLNKKGLTSIFLFLTACLAVFYLCSCAPKSDETASGTYFVSPDGSDKNPGNKQKPFKTIEKAAKIIKPGETCFLRGGVYREQINITTSGTKDKPIRFEAYNNETVIMDGTKAIKPDWKLHKGKIYKTKTSEPFVQLFVDRQMMIEARWPNMPFEEIFNKKNWSKANKGSRYGKLVSEEIAKTGIDWTGAMATLNIAHQWWTWNRPIEMHQAGSSALYYAQDLVGLCGYGNETEMDNKFKKTAGWEDDYFYLFGKLEALDVETEWYRDDKTGELYFYAPGGVNPNDLNISVKVQDYAFILKDVDYVEIKGLKFFATTFRMEDCNYCTAEDFSMLYPSYTRTITEYDAERTVSPMTTVTGDHNTIKKVSMAYANNMGIITMGAYNTVENCIIRDVNWFGTLIYPALQLSGSPHLGVNWFGTIQYPATPWSPENTDVSSPGSVARKNTLYNCGNTLLMFQAMDSLVEYNHIYDGGKACKDVSLVYGSFPFCRGSIVRYNWVHGCITDHYRGRGGLGGIGIRADDQSRNNSYHHNVVWDCGLAGILMKGEGNTAFNNTVFDVGNAGVEGNYIMMQTAPEPEKPWALQWPNLPEQNKEAKIFNNIAHTITAGRNKPFPQDDRNTNNYQGKKLPLMDIANFDFRPVLDSELIDAGKTVPGLVEDYKGQAPDIGAYELDGDNWVPGADWKEDYSW